ncbi:MAG: hypothetical protein WDZ70_00675 [Candidatus Paceibacterota bacterium]
MTNGSFEWQAHEYEHSEKTTDWFWVVGLIAATLAVIAILMQNLLFALLIIIATIALLLLAVRKPRVIRFEINEKGVVVDELLYPFSTLESFWVEDRFFKDKLIIKSQKPLMPLLIIPLEGVGPEETRQIMLQFLPEEEQEEPLSHSLMERLGF